MFTVSKLCSKAFCPSPKLLSPLFQPLKSLENTVFLFANDGMRSNFDKSTNKKSTLLSRGCEHSIYMFVSGPWIFANVS